jgi:hypothetical protein
MAGVVWSDRDRGYDVTLSAFADKDRQAIGARSHSGAGAFSFAGFDA